MVEGLRHEAMEVIKKSITSTNVLDFLRDTALVKEIMSQSVSSFTPFNSFFMVEF